MAKTTYRPEYAEQAHKLCLLGATNAEIAQFLNISTKTIDNWKAANEDFLRALKEGKEYADANVAHSLYQKAINGDTTACIFWLKNRRKDLWRDRTQTEHSGSIDSTIKTVVVLPPKEQ